MPSLPKIRKRNFLPFLSTLVLFLSVVTGVVLVKQQQVLRIGAWDCLNYVFEVSQDGVVTVRNGSTRDEPAQQAVVYIDREQMSLFDVPALTAGDAATIGIVSVPVSGDFTWEVIGSSDCENSGSYQSIPTPTLLPSITPTLTPTPGCPLASVGDINCDGVVNIIDFQILSNRFGINDPSADLNNDGIVNIIDYQILSNNFGRS